MHYFCTRGRHEWHSSYCDEHDSNTAPQRSRRTSAADRTGSAESPATGTAGPGEAPDPAVRARLGSILDPDPETPHAGTADGMAPDDRAATVIPPGLGRRYRLLSSFPEEIGVGGRLWIAAPTHGRSSQVLLKVHQPGFSPDDVLKERVRSHCGAHVAALKNHGIEAAPDGRPVSWEELEWPAGGRLRDVLEGVRDSSGAGPHGGLPEQTVRAILFELTALIEAWSSDAKAIVADLSTHTLLCRIPGGAGLLVADLDGAASVGASRSRGPELPVTPYLTPRHLVRQGRWHAADSWPSVAVIIHELLTAEAPLADVVGNQAMTDAVLARQAPPSIGEPAWDELLRRLSAADPAERWGASDVREWLENCSARRPRQEPFVYKGVGHQDPADLVVALVDDGDRATDWLHSNDNAGDLLMWLVEGGHDEGLDGGTFRRPGARRSGPWAAEMCLAVLSARFTPFAAPRFHGRPIDEDGLRRLARGHAVTVIRDVLDSGVLEEAARHQCARHSTGAQGCPVLGRLAELVPRAAEATRERAVRALAAVRDEAADTDARLRADMAELFTAHRHDAGSVLDLPSVNDDQLYPTVLLLALGDEEFLASAADTIGRARPNHFTMAWWTPLYEEALAALRTQEAPAAVGEAKPPAKASAPLGAPAISAVALALMLADQVVLHAGHHRRARRAQLQAVLRRKAMEACVRIRQATGRGSVEDRQAAVERRRETARRAHQGLLTVRWLWLLVFTVALLDFAGYVAYGWQPYTPPPAAVTAAPDRGTPKKASGTDPPAWRSAPLLWQEARTEVDGDETPGWVDSWENASVEVAETRPEWLDDGAVFGWKAHLSGVRPWLPALCSLLAMAAALRWAVRTVRLRTRVAFAVLGSVAAVALAWHLWADGLVHALLGVTLALRWPWPALFLLAGLIVSLRLLGPRESTRPDNNSTYRR